MSTISTTPQFFSHLPLPQIDLSSSSSFFPNSSQLLKLTLKVGTISGIVLGIALAVAAPAALATYSFTLISSDVLPFVTTIKDHWLTALKTLLSITGKLIEESRANNGDAFVIIALVPIALIGGLLLLPALPFAVVAAPGIKLAQLSKQGYDLIDGIGETEETAINRNFILPPFPSILAEKIVTWGNFFIGRGLYSKENIASFYDTDYVAVFNNALFYSIYDSFTVVSGTLRVKQTSAQVTERELSPTVLEHWPEFVTILQEYNKLTPKGKEALPWHLCCDGGILSENLIAEGDSDFIKIRAIMGLIGNIRIELVEHGILRSDLNTIKEAFTKLHE